MRLSEAMMLGSTTCKMVSGDWNTCAIGCAANAVGLVADFNFVLFGERHESFARIDGLQIVWPWLNDGNHRDEITDCFDKEVCEGLKTFEQLVDYVRSIEPSCGDCNRFDCTCKPAEVAESIEVHTHA